VSAPTPPTLEFLFSLRADVALAGLLAGAPTGERVVMETATGHFAGPRLRGTLKANNMAARILQAQRPALTGRTPGRRPMEAA
jgi:hypothetical protein